jgi:hypothetical protein
MVRAVPHSVARTALNTNRDHGVMKMKPRLRPLETLRLIRHGLIPGVAWKLESLSLDTWDLENEAAWHLLPQKKTREHHTVGIISTHYQYRGIRDPCAPPGHCSQRGLNRPSQSLTPSNLLRSGSRSMHDLQPETRTAPVRSRTCGATSVIRG